MRQLPTIQGESLDDAVNRLLEAKAKGQHVFLKFNKVNLLSDTVTLEQAYFDVYDCSRDAYFSKSNEVIEPEEEERAFRYEPKDVIRDIRISILIGARDLDTKQYHSEVAKSYIRDISRYANYCSDSTKGDWKTTIEYYIYSIGSKEPDSDKELYTDEQIEAYLILHEKVGKTMKAIMDNKTWEDISKMVVSFNLSNDDISKFKEIICHFSSRGKEFVDNVFGPDPEVLKKVPKKDKKKD
ncbi:MAG: hypothetical protein IKZ96_02150 [Bacilli bacterium]|nr:hypothetical protein [Bacilli bacterium]